MTYYLYIIQSEKKDIYYIGSSGNPCRRLFYHNSESKGFTKQFRPWKLIYTQSFESKSSALKAENRVKAWKSKKMIRLLINHTINIHDYIN
ncbi:MAG: GIY-YIG nuclease family protein [Balneolaceae bacterium]